VENSKGIYLIHKQFQANPSILRVHFDFAVAMWLQTHPEYFAVHFHHTLLQFGDFSLVVSRCRPKNRGIRKMFRKPTEITIITKEDEHFKLVGQMGGCGWFSKKTPIVLFHFLTKFRYINE
jgi:hypothetical protein